MIDVAAARADTPGAAFVTHFNNACASLAPRPVLDAVTDYLREESRYGGYEVAEAHTEDLSSVYDTVAALVGADRSEIAFTDSATRGWDSAFSAMTFHGGDRILTTATEYASNVIGLQFHLEYSAESIEKMLAHCGNELAPAPFVQSQQQISAGLAHVEATQKLLGSLLDSLLHHGDEDR